MYSIRAILEKQPAAIAGGIRAVLSVLVLAGLLNLGEELLAGVYLGAEVILGLFVYQTSTPVASPTLPAGTEVAVKGTEDKVVIAETPPGPTGVEGG
jgi:hypothetical protein